MTHQASVRRLVVLAGKLERMGERPAPGSEAAALAEEAVALYQAVHALGTGADAPTGERREEAVEALARAGAALSRHAIPH